MTDVEGILKKIQDLYRIPGAAPVDVPLGLHAREFGYLARSYIAAASVVDSHAPQHWLPILQLTGQAVELSLKSCLASAGSVPPSGHDLIDLYRQSAALGFALDAPMFAAIVHLQHFYFMDLATGTRFKARYPTKRRERLGGAVPSNAVFSSIVDALLDQARQRETTELPPNKPLQPTSGGRTPSPVRYTPNPPLAAERQR
jgi:hypothetical protein